MFDIGFSELFLVFVIGLLVLGPKRLPVAIRTVMSWVSTLRGLANNVQNELKQELKLQELQDSIKKAEALHLQQFSPELNKTVEELKASAQKIRSSLESKAAEANTSLNEQIQQMKSAVQNQPDLSPEQIAMQDVAEKVAPTEVPTETAENSTALEAELSPAELAELAEEGDPMAQIQQYYGEDDVLADSSPSQPKEKA